MPNKGFARILPYINLVGGGGEAAGDAGAGARAAAAAGEGRQRGDLDDGAPDHRDAGKGEN